ncbi:hypothetical protein LWI29_037922 [Acer saccharum]|uniref:Phytocyanin domain-containing protein n=1 Tax=Acer saccharum TaxID=4024 RepID=A0AA39T072_ACESA|nr:hypothetical protein LWI29_037922 [Acer saccharum]
MASVKTTALALVLMATATLLSLFQISSAAVYKVGDSAGWTTIGNVDYKTWAATKTFQVGDIIPMASVKTTALALVLMATATLLSLFQISSAAVYKVGDSAGWTTIGNVDYKTWAATKTFQVGDIIQISSNVSSSNRVLISSGSFGTRTGI